MQVLGISCDSVATHKAFAESLGGIRYPLLADWEPKGQVARAFGVFNETGGAPYRSAFVLDKDGVVRWSKLIERGKVPDPAEILEVVRGLS